MSSQPSLSAILVAGGSSRRMGFDKILAPLAGSTVLGISLAAYDACVDVSSVVVVCPAGRESEFTKICQRSGKVSAVVAGGAERPDSVLAGARALTAADAQGMVAVHDAARPLVTPHAISLCYQAALQHGAAALAERVVDTLHRTDTAGAVLETVSRENLWRVQTPQILPLHTLLALDAARGRTDEISALHAAGLPAFLVENPSPNFKMTLPSDLLLAEALLASPQE